MELPVPVSAEVTRRLGRELPPSAAASVPAPSEGSPLSALSEGESIDRDASSSVVDHPSEGSPLQAPPLQALPLRGFPSALLLHHPVMVTPQSRSPRQSRSPLPLPLLPWWSSWL